jgi:hypothetical protein
VRQAELREVLRDQAEDAGEDESDLDGIRGWAGAGELQEGLEQVLLLLFNLSRSNNLPQGLKGARAAAELHDAAVALGRQEAPQIVALLQMYVRLHGVALCDAG